MATTGRTPGRTPNRTPNRTANGARRRRRKKKQDNVKLILQGLMGLIAIALVITVIVASVQSIRDSKKLKEIKKDEHMLPGDEYVQGEKNPGGEDTEVSPTPTPTPTEIPEPTATPTPTPDPTKKRIAFSFDDGPHFELTRKFVDELNKYNGHATWFIVGNRMFDAAAEGIQYAAECGNEIAIHGWTHENYYDVSSDEVVKMELSKTADVIIQYTGKAPTLMRPYGGNITKERIESCPYAVILWSCDSEDWRNKKRTDDPAFNKANIQKSVDNVMKSVKDGDIILMHEIYENSYQAFCILAKTLHDQGYEFVTVTELLGDPQPGHRYVNR